jgi:hypothetical protein
LWIHSYSSTDITLKIISRDRGREVLEEIGIIPKYSGTIIQNALTR